jgi:integrase
MDKKNLCPTLNDYGGDLSRRWYVNTYDPITLSWAKIMVSSKFKNIEARRAEAQRIIDSLSHCNPPQKETVTGSLQSAQKKKGSRQRKKGAQTYQSKVNVFTKWLARKKYQDTTITAEIVSEFREYLITVRKVGGTTINAYFSTLATIYKDLDKSGINPFLVKKEKAVKTPAHFFSNAQAKRIGNYLFANDYQLWQFTRLMCYCFLRPGELCQITVADVLLDTNQIRVQSSVAKNERMEYAMIPSQVRPILESLILDRLPTDFLFTNQYGTEASPRKIADRHQKILSDLRFDTKKYKLYSWRHTGAVACVFASINISQLCRLMRHSDETQTVKYLRSMGLSDIASDLVNKFPDI